mmetsp:Transcript_38692/g.125550  ORF Transcript_38692/g.125550 Transcript_38692/m.125550 type:complete len:804 (+) Transcript_38692:1439-3850(+)
MPRAASACARHPRRGTRPLGASRRRLAAPRRPTPRRSRRPARRQRPAHLCHQPLCRRLLSRRLLSRRPLCRPLCRPLGRGAPRRARLLGRLRGLRLGRLRGLHHLESDLAADALDVLLQVAHAGLAAVPADERGDRVVGQLHRALLEAHLLFRGGDEVLVRNLHLLVEDVPREAHHLHPVEQRAGDRAGVVGGAEEEDLGEVDGRVEVVVHEGRVLRRVEHLEQRRRGVALVAAAQLVDFVNEHHRVRGARRLEALDQLARHRTHVRPPVALDLGDVGQAAHGEAVELAAECARDGLADRRLADAGRADEADDLSLSRSDEGADRDELEDALLDILETVVLLREDLLGAGELKVLLRVDAPREGGEPVEVVSRHVELGGRRLERADLRHLLVDDLARLLGHVELLDPVGELLEEGVLVVPLEAELFLDLLELLHQHVPPLVRRDLVFDLLRDLRLQPGELELLLQEKEGLLDPRRHVERREDLLQLLRVRRGQRGAKVGQLACLVDLGPLEDHLHLLLEEGVELEDLLDGLHDLHRVRLGERRAPARGVVQLVRRLFHPREDHRRGLHRPAQPHSLVTEQQQLHASRRLREARHLSERTNLVQRRHVQQRRRRSEGAVGGAADRSLFAAATDAAAAAAAVAGPSGDHLGDFCAVVGGVQVADAAADFLVPLLGQEDANIRQLARLDRQQRLCERVVGHLCRLVDAGKERPRGEGEDEHGRQRGDVARVDGHERRLGRLCFRRHHHSRLHRLIGASQLAMLCGNIAVLAVAVAVARAAARRAEESQRTVGLRHAVQRRPGELAR